MALELQTYQHHSGILFPATPETSDILQSKTRLGDVLVASSDVYVTGIPPALFRTSQSRL